MPFEHDCQECAKRLADKWNETGRHPEHDDTRLCIKCHVFDSEDTGEPTIPLEQQIINVADYL